MFVVVIVDCAQTNTSTITSMVFDLVVCEGTFNISIKTQETNGKKHGCNFGNDLS